MSCSSIMLEIIKLKQSCAINTTYSGVNSTTYFFIFSARLPRYKTRRRVERSFCRPQSRSFFLANIRVKINENSSNFHTNCTIILAETADYDANRVNLTLLYRERPLLYPSPRRAAPRCASPYSSCAADTPSAPLPGAAQG